MNQKQRVLREAWQEWASDSRNAKALVAFDAAGGIPDTSPPPGFRWLHGSLVDTRLLGGDLKIPLGLSRLGRKAAFVIRDFFLDKNLSTGGCRMFYSLHEWSVERSERYHETAELVVVFDGGEMYEIINDDDGYFTRWHEELRLRLEAVGVYWEQGHRWNMGIYPIER